MPTQSVLSPDGRYCLNIVMPDVGAPDAVAEISLVRAASGETLLELIGPPVMPAAMFAGGNQLHLALGGRSGRAWMIVIDLEARTFRIPGRIDQAHPLSGLGAGLDSLRNPDSGEQVPPVATLKTPLTHFVCARHRPLPLGWSLEEGSRYSDSHRFRVDFGTYAAATRPVRAVRIVHVDTDDVLLDLIGTLWDSRAEFVEGSTDLIKLRLDRIDNPASARTAFSDLDVEMYWPDLGPGPHPEAVRYLDELHTELVEQPGILTYQGPPPRVRPSRMRPEMILRAS